MSIKQGEYLKKLRTDNKLSQDALSEILGISRQSISKWEQGNSSPDIENTEKLATYYGVSIDSIVRGEPDSTTASIINSVESQEKGRTEQSPNDILNSFSQSMKPENGSSAHTHKADNDEPVNPKKAKKKRGWLFVSFPVIAVIIYCILGVLFSPEGWYIGWTVLLTIPLFYTGIIAIEKKKPVIFCYPVLVLLIFMLLGLCKSLWHPSWILFLTIPLFYIIAAKTGKKN